MDRKQENKNGIIDLLIRIDRTIELVEEFMKKCENKNLPGTLRLLKEDREKMKSLLDSYLQGESISHELSDNSLHHLVTAYQKIRSLLCSLSNMLADPVDYSFEREEEETPSESEENFTSGIFAFLEDGRIYLRLPQLPHESKPVTMIRSGSGRSFPINSTRVFASETRYVMKKLYDDHPEIFSMFSDKTIQYLFILDPKFPIMDSDHRETEAITNAIVDYMAGGDSALCCSFSYSSRMEKKLHPGTYITVTPQKDASPHIQETITFWEKKQSEIIHYAFF